MGKIYKNDVGTEIKVDCGTSLSGATNTILKVKKPNGVEVEWTATIVETQKLKYVIVSGDLNQAGVYYVNPSLTLGDWSGLGETTSFIVYDNYK